MNISTLFNWVRQGSLIALAATTLITTGCGGGGGDGGDSPSTAPSGTDTPPGQVDPVTGNKAPTISGTPATQVNVGSSYALTPAATDADGDTLAFSVENLPTWAKFSTATGELTGTPAAANVGTFANVAISVSDGKARVELPAFSITVAAADSAPVAGTPPVAGTGKGAVTLQWTIPTETTEKTSLQLAGYRIHYGKSSTTLTNAVEVTNASLSTLVVDQLAPGTYYFAVRAIDATGSPSELSNVLEFVVT